MSEKVGFIGLGEMGMPMAANLQKAGFQVYAYARREAVIKEAEGYGIICCDSVKEVVESADKTVVSIVRTAEQTEEVFFGERGIASSAKKGLTIIMASTLTPAIASDLQDRIEAAGFNMVDAPCSGARAGAESATLSFMTGGKEEVFQACQPYFQAMGKNIFYFGARCGAGQSAKLTNNLILGINIVGVAEGLRFAGKYGLPQEELLRLFSTSTANSWSAANWPTISKWALNGPPAVMMKDLTAVLNECNDDFFSLPVGALTWSLFIDAVFLGREKK